MLYIFAMHPWYYFIPAVTTLVIWILLARFWPKTESGDAEMILREPGIIVCGSGLWFLTVPFLIMGVAVALLSAAVGWLTKAR